MQSSERIKHHFSIQYQYFQYQMWKLTTGRGGQAEEQNDPDHLMNHYAASDEKGLLKTQRSILVFYKPELLLRKQKSVMRQSENTEKELSMFH